MYRGGRVCVIVMVVVVMGISGGDGVCVCVVECWGCDALFVVVLRPNNTYGHMSLGTVLQQCILMKLYTAAPLGDQAADILIRYPAQSFLLGSVLTSHFPILLMPNIRLGSDKYQFCKSLD